MIVDAEGMLAALISLDVHSLHLMLALGGWVKLIFLLAGFYRHNLA